MLIFGGQAARLADIIGVQALYHALGTLGLLHLARPLIYMRKQKRTQITHDLCHMGGLLHHTVMRMADHIHHQRVDALAVGAPQRLYNQVANYTFLEKRINIAIGKKSPKEYFGIARDAITSEDGYFGDIADLRTLRSNLEANCIPEGIFEMEAADYEDFLAQRRQLMAKKIEQYFKNL